MKKISIISLAMIAILITVSGVAMAVPDASGSDSDSDVKILLAKLRAATAGHLIIFGDETDGYISTRQCVPQMGIHYVNPELASDQSVDALKPEILLYEQKKGLFRLVGVEYFMVALANTSEGPKPWFGTTPPPGGFLTAKPTLFGRQFDGPMPGHDPEMPWHYDLHAYIWKSNPNGTFETWNSKVKC